MFLVANWLFETRMRIILIDIEISEFSKKKNKAEISALYNAQQTDYEAKNLNSAFIYLQLQATSNKISVILSVWRTNRLLRKQK